jgi:pantetheine-phosphate adenylyltransferase
MKSNTEHIIAVYPGSFDPVTHGHLDVIRRASTLFNELIIGIGRNPGKDVMFTPQERLDLLLPLLDEWPHVRAESYDGLTFDFVRQCRARVIVRGIRDTTDLSNELLQANLNLTVGQIDTVFLLTRDQHVLTSSTYIKQIYEMGGGDLQQLERLVPRNVAEALARKLRPERQDA